MSHAVRIHENGGPEVLRWEPVEFKPGDRVAYAQPMGAYAEILLRPADRLVKIPAGVDGRTAAAMMLKGMTAQFLLHRTYRVKRGDTILVHAAAGGVGQILCQWARYLGAHVIGTVGSEAKLPLAKKAGCRHVIVTARAKVSERVREITEGASVAVVYDGVGKDTFMESLDCLAPLGRMVSYGNASEAVPPFEVATLAQKGSLFLTRPTMMTYLARREDLVRSARAVHRGQEGRGQDCDQSNLCAERCHPGAPRS